MILPLLVLHVLAAFGAAYIVGHSVISEPLRVLIGGPASSPRPYLGRVVELLECPACFGTWFGGVAGGFFPGVFLLEVWWQGALVGALLTCATNLILAKHAGILPPSEGALVREEMAGRLIRTMEMLMQQQPAMTDNAAKMLESIHASMTAPPPPPPSLVSIEHFERPEFISPPIMAMPHDERLGYLGDDACACFECAELRSIEALMQVESEEAYNEHA